MGKNAYFKNWLHFKTAEIFFTKEDLVRFFKMWFQYSCFFISVRYLNIVVQGSENGL